METIVTLFAAIFAILWLAFVWALPAVLMSQELQDKKFPCPNCNSICKFAAFHNIFHEGSAYFKCESCHKFFNSSAVEISDFKSFVQIIP